MFFMTWRYQKLLEHYTSMKPTFGGECFIYRPPSCDGPTALHRVLRCLRTRTYTRIAGVDSDTWTFPSVLIVCLSHLSPHRLSRPLTTYDTVTSDLLLSLTTPYDVLCLLTLCFLPLLSRARALARLQDNQNNVTAQPGQSSDVKLREKL